MEASNCPRCRKSMQIQAEPRHLPCRCPSCGIRVKVATRAINKDPALQTAIAAGHPKGDQVSGVRLVDEIDGLPCLMRLLLRIRIRRRNAGVETKARNLSDGPIGWLFLLYTWFPIVASVCALTLLPAAAFMAFAPPIFEVDPTVSLLTVSLFLGSCVALAISAIWLRCRHAASAKLPPQDGAEKAVTSALAPDAPAAIGNADLASR